MKTLAIFGGTFDPVHQGHLQSALELKQRLQLDEVRMLPCRLPPHRESPGCSAEQRLAMVRLACEGSELQVDDREILRSGPSYSVETLEQLRVELGDEVSLSWVMGADAFCGLDRWHRWQELLSLAHLLIIARPGVELPVEGVLGELLARHDGDNAEHLKQACCGRIVKLALTPHPISATEIRQAIARGQIPAHALPPGVVNYIQQHQLYR